MAVNKQDKKDSILLIDDDVDLCELLSEYLSEAGFNISCVHDGKAAQYLLSKQTFSLIILDIMLPEIDGLSLLKQWDKLPRRQAPVIMLSAKGDDIDRILGLELGADDYLPKPCNPRELLARIRAVLKRSEIHQQVANDFRYEAILLQLDKRICYVEETALNLTGTEFDLLYFLLQHRGQVVDKETLSINVLQRPLQALDRSIDVHISRLRKKLMAFYANPILSVRGKGYQLTL